MAKLSVIYQSNDAFAPFLGVSLLSLLENNHTLEQLTVYIIDIQIAAENKRKIEKLCCDFMCECRWVDAAIIDKKIKKSGMPQYLGFRKNSMSIMKIFAFDLLEETRVVYIDCDTIVQGSLAQLAEIDIGKDNAIGMVVDSIVPAQYKQSIHMQPTEAYFNSGVILVDVEKWKQRRCLQRIVDFAGAGNVFGTVDQDYLNVVLGKETCTLPLKYNVQCIHMFSSAKWYRRIYHDIQPYYPEQEIEQAIVSPAILHYEKLAGMSPWHRNSVNPCTRLFDQYLAHSPWKAYQKQPAPRKGRAYEIEKVLLRLLPGDAFAAVFRIASNRMLVNSSKRAIHQKYTNHVLCEQVRKHA